MKLTALAVVILALGIVAGFALRDTVFEAEAAKPPPEGRLIEVGTLPAPANGTVQFPVIDLRDCSQPSLMAQNNSTLAGGSVNFVNLSVSIDGTNMFGAEFLNATSSNVGGSALLGSWPFVQFELGHSADATTITAWLWCAP